MDNKQIKKLQSIDDFPDLVEYLRDELDWPIEENDFDDLTFEYSATELGIDELNAAKIVEIKRLRPLDAHQPWGIFFVSLEPKQLPVVALRRLLSKISLKKRASANKSDQAVWHHDDILFISNFGDENERQLSFAHFAVNEDKGDLPVLKVLGWDNKDTKLHVDAVVETLKEKLLWPEDVADTDSWRQQWRDAFTLRHKEVVSTSKEMAIRLADLARNIRDSIISVLNVEAENGPLRQIMETFREALIHDLDEEGFADMYAQTIAYGLLSARIADPHGSNTVEHLGDHMRTNPFLRELMETFLDVGGRKRGKQKGAGLDFDELGVSDVVELLDNANMEAVVRDFGDRNPREDPVIHFYELFLSEYDSKKRMLRGVFYTPRPVVSFIVHSIDATLRNEFNLELGLADTTTWGEMIKRTDNLQLPEGVSLDQPFVQILDPATGTGTFLIEVIDVIYQRLKDKWENEGFRSKEITRLWNEYVPQYLLKRIYGYELMMAPYAIAHMKIGLKLLETGYDFQSVERARVYLTNALESADDSFGRFDFAIPALAHESEAVNSIKQNQRFTVLLGNPPYSDASQNIGEQFKPLIEKFRYFNGEKIREKGAIRFEHAINNDYVKFFGLAGRVLDESLSGVICFVTSSSFIDGKSFRGLRDTLLNDYFSLCITNLHGGGWSGALAQSGIEDENVFEIQTGVSVTKGVKRGNSNAFRSTLYADVIGSREDKFRILTDDVETIGYQAANLNSNNYYSFVPSEGESYDEYWEWPSLYECFDKSTDGIKTSRDGLVVANSKNECVQKIKRFSVVDNNSIAEFSDAHSFSISKLNIAHVQKHLSSTFDENKVHSFAYRPYDFRYIYYDKELVFSHRMGVMSKLNVPESWAIVCASRLSSKGFNHILAANTLCAHKYSSHDVNSRMFPVLMQEDSGLFAGLQSNVVEGFLDGLRPNDCSDTEWGNLRGWYILAVLSSTEYSRRYHEQIQQDFPRVPLPSELALLRNLAELGRALAKVQNLDQSPPRDKYQFHGNYSDVALAPKNRDSKLWIGKNSYIENVGQNVFDYKQAGYSVVKSWFSAGNRSSLARKGETITSEMVCSLRGVLWSIHESIRIIENIDDLINGFGGWPGAFVTAEESSESAEHSTDNYEPTGEALEPELFDKVADSDANKQD